MPLHVITGRAHAGVGHQIRDRLIGSVRSAERALLLVPSAPDVSRATAELAAHVAIGAAVRTFDDHLNALWESVGDGRTIATPTQRLVVLEESGKSWIPRSPGLSADTAGVVRILATIVQRAAEAPGVDEYVAHGPGVGADLFAYAALYRDRLRSVGLIERAEAHRLAGDALPGVGHPAFIGVEGFSGLTKAQELFLIRVSSTSDVTIGLAFDESVPATHACAELVERLMAAGGIRTHVAEQAGGRPEELARLADALGSTDSADTQPGGAIVLSEAWGGQAEAARIVREAQDALAEGVSPGDIAVVLRDPAERMRELRAAFGEAGIAAEYDARVPFHATGLGRALMLMLGLAEEGGPYRHLMDVLRSPFSPATHRTLDDLDAHVRRSQVSGSRDAEAWLRRGSPECASFIADVRRACREIGGLRAERQWYRIITAMLRRAHGAEAVATEDLTLDATAARVFIEAIRSMSALGDHAAGAATLASALRETVVALAPAGPSDRVQVMGAERARGRDYACVIIGGLTAGEFPRRSTQDALTAPAIARVFEEAGVDLSPRSDIAAERLLFYLAATRASQRLVLSWQSHDSEGRPVRPSDFLEEVLDLYRRPGSEPGDLAGLPHRVLRLDTQATDFAAPLTRRREQRAGAAPGPGEASSCEPELIEARRRAGYTKDPISSAVAHSVSERSAFSASEIETYLQCAFRWYVDRMVRPRELDERFDRSAAGRLGHDIMKEFYDRFIERSGLPRVTPDSLALACEVHSEVAEAALRDAGTITAAEAAAARAMVRQTLQLVERDALMLEGFAPTYREWSFGMGDDPPEVFRGFSLAGRIDRIDTSADTLVVTDYKSGTSTGSRAVAKFEVEGIVQLPLYSAVAARRLGRTVAGGLYRPIGGGKPRGFVSETLRSPDFVRNDVVDDETIAHVIEEAELRAAGAVDRMRAGDIRPQPRGGSCPAYCPARGFCAEWRPGRG